MGLLIAYLGEKLRKISKKANLSIATLSAYLNEVWKMALPKPSSVIQYGCINFTLLFIILKFHFTGFLPRLQDLCDSFIVYYICFRFFQPFCLWKQTTQKDKNVLGFKGLLMPISLSFWRRKRWRCLFLRLYKWYILVHFSHFVGAPWWYQVELLTAVAWSHL